MRKAKWNGFNTLLLWATVSTNLRSGRDQKGNLGGGFEVTIELMTSMCGNGRWSLKGKTRKRRRKLQTVMHKLLYSDAFIHATNTFAHAKHAAETYEGVSYNPLKRLNFAEYSCGKVVDYFVQPVLPFHCFILHSREYNS